MALGGAVLSNDEIKRAMKELKKGLPLSSREAEELLNEVAQRRGIELADAEVAKFNALFNSIQQAVGIRSAGRGSLESTNRAIQIIRDAIDQLDL